MDLVEYTDEVLVEKIMAGDIEAMDFLMNKYKNLECMANSYPTIREIVYEYEHRG